MSAEEKEKLQEEAPAKARRSWRRRAVLALGGVAVLILLVGLVGVVLYRTGAVDSYVRSQFVTRLDEMGIVFDADAFRLTGSPFELTLRNASFKDKVTGERLFFIREAHIGLTILDALSLQLSRDIKINSTDIAGAEVWVKFDAEGRSNFSNLKFVEDEAGSAVNFRYESVKFSLTDSIVHFGDLSRRLSGDAKNIIFNLSPDDPDARENRHKFDLTSTDSNFSYEERAVEKIDLRAVGIADDKGAEFSQFELKTPLGQTTLTGTITDWASPKYAFDIDTSIDLTQASGIILPGTQLTGVGNFRGKLTGEGETYKVEGNVASEALRANGVYLKAVNVVGTVAGTNTNYEANGTAIAEMLTFEDFRVDLLKLVGNVRGTGTDFRWLGDLQAAAASSKDLSLGGLFLSDARAEFKDRQLRAETPNGRAKRFAIGDNEFTDLAAGDLRFTLNGDNIELSSPRANARSFVTKDFRLDGMAGRNLRVKRKPGDVSVDIGGIRSDTAEIKGNKAKGVSADDFRFRDLPGSTGVTAKNLRVDRVDIAGSQVDGLEAPAVEIENTAAGLVVYADKTRVAKIDAGAAVLGSLNIGGVRLTVRKGRVEARSNDIDAGNVAIKKTEDILDGGTLESVKIGKPIFVLEPSGRYRATADMSLGGGALGSISLGAATAKIDVNNQRVALNELTAQIMDGQLNGQAVIAIDGRSQSQLTGNFSDLDIGKLLAWQMGSVTPVEGQTTGDVDLTFTGTNFRNANGTVSADIRANAGTADSGLVPVNGQVRLSAVNGLFNVDQADLTTPNSKLTANGRFDLKNDDSDLTLALRSSDASEIDRVIRVLQLMPEMEEQLDSMQVAVAGDLTFDGTVSGNVFRPNVNGRVALSSISLRGREVGKVSTDVAVSPTQLDLLDGKLEDRGGGSAAFAVNVPFGGVDNVSVNATLTNIDAGNLLAVLPIELPEQIRDLDGQTSGTVNIRGLPNKADGSIDLASAKGMVAGQNFDDLKVKAVFSGTDIDLQQAEMRFGAGSLTAKGKFDRLSTTFNFELGGNSVPVPLVLAILPKNDSIPVITGDLNFTANATGTYDQPQTYDVGFDGLAPNIQIGETVLGQVTFKGKTSNRVLNADLTATLDARPQVVTASVDFSSENLPFAATTDFDHSPIAPVLAFVPQVKGLDITGTATGRIDFGGNLSQIDDTGKRIFSGSALSGTAELSQLNLQIEDTPLAAAEPILVRFNTREIIFDKARFAGSGSNMTIAGTKAMVDSAVNNLSIDGRVNLKLINLFVEDTFFAGLADTSVRLSGPNSTARLSGTANIVNGSVATFLGSDRFTVERLKARVIFTSDQVEVEEATGYLGGGKFTGSGGGTLEGLAVKAFRFTLNGNNVAVPLPKDFTTTGDAQLEITGIRPNANSNLQLTIGGRVYARRSIYSRDIDLANLVGGRRDPTLSGGNGSITPPQFDLIVEGRDALVVKNNIADLTASVSLQLTGDADNPRLSGRITANSGTIFFRKDRYEVQRGVLEFPPDTAIEPVINLQAESEIGGYQVFVNLAGPLKDSEQLSATVRSSPALPQADVVSLITTGSLTNTSGGIPTLAQTGINTAAEILTDTIINNPARKATDKLFGLNVFEIDPLISGQQLNPSARLTVGRQINNNLRVTYSTNLSQDQNQVLALEYRVSNKLSFVAQYEQRSLSNVTRNRDNFGFEIRFRKRF
ncbi:MAG: translocation/assembly module TamB domain-containing protein [Pyrinomonadaceae bacterium]